MRPREVSPKVSHIHSSLPSPIQSHQRTPRTKWFDPNDPEILETIRLDEIKKHSFRKKNNSEGKKYVYVLAKIELLPQCNILPTEISDLLKFKGKECFSQSILLVRDGMQNAGNELINSVFFPPFLRNYSM